jgi:hypothetical protein
LQRASVASPPRSRDRGARSRSRRAGPGFWVRLSLADQADDGFDELVRARSASASAAEESPELVRFGFGIEAGDRFASNEDGFPKWQLNPEAGDEAAREWAGSSTRYSSFADDS